MVTGWFQDQDGYRYYLNPVSDRTLGRMMTGWVWIPGEDGQLRCYYFQEHSDGWRGALYKNRMTPDGFMVNDEGAWIVENEVQIR
jgi:glucan-binding YG repeat protein